MQIIEITPKNIYTCQFCGKDFETPKEEYINLGFNPVCSNRCKFRLIFNLFKKFNLSKENLLVLAKNNDVKLDYSKDINETLRNFIYFERKMNMNQVAELTGHSRQYLWAVLNRRMKASFSYARKICDILGVKEIKTLFRDDDIDYPFPCNVNAPANLDYKETPVSQSPESSLNSPSNSKQNLEVNKNE